ncbi:hypothetical protein N8456_07875 [Porticoccaceae bacterium]|nr:hypothetical protein [Porticoccaceae bacterium]MDC1513994.1 hypothetical protein [Porticoccaceae bacterium]
MKKLTSQIILVLFLCGAASANEMHNVAPTNYEISGSDVQGNSAYTISVVLNHDVKITTIEALDVSIYKKRLSVPAEIIAQAENPDLGSISVTNDSGVFGSYFYIRVPFGKKGFFCKKKPYIYISSLPAMNGGDLEAKVLDPCK